MTETIAGKGQLKKILFVTRRFYPHGDANSVVISNLAQELISQNIETEVLALSCERKDEKIQSWQGIKIRNVYLPGFIGAAELSGLVFSRPLYFFQCAIQKMLGKIISQRKKYRFLSADYLYVHVYKRELRKIFREDKYDLYILNIMPHEAVMAAEAMNLKYSAMPIAFYQMDTYWNNNLFPAKYQSYRKEFEKRISQLCMFNLTTPQIVEENINIYGKESAKLIASEFPMIKKTVEVKNQNKGNKQIHCAFIGTLYADIRPPEKIISTIAEIQQDGIIFDFYGSNQNLIISDPMYSRAKKNIYLHGAIPTAEAEKARNEADILINIDNTIMNQVPSKIFEYISTGKPIINFYFNDKSPILSYLSRYPLCLNIHIDKKFSPREASDQIEKFLSDVKGRRIDFETIEKNYYENTPQYVANQLKQAFSFAKGGIR